MICVPFKVFPFITGHSVPNIFIPASYIKWFIQTAKREQREIETDEAVRPCKCKAIKAL